MNRIIRFLILQGISFIVVPVKTGKKFAPILNFKIGKTNFYICENKFEGKKVYLTTLEKETGENANVKAATQMEVNTLLKSIIDATNSQDESQKN